MEEIKTKPSTKVEQLLLFIGVLLTLLALGISIIINMFEIFMIMGYTIVIFFISIISSMVHKSFTTYTISENEIEDYYQFISKTSKIYRMDQITSLSLNQSFFQKLVGLGSLNFGIFGNSQLYQKSGQGGIVAQKINSLENYQEIFDLLSKRLHLVSNKQIHLDKPSQTPINFWILTFGLSSLILLIVLITSIYYAYQTYPNGELYIFSSIISLILLFITVIGLISSIFSKLKIRTENYQIFNKIVQTSYNYILGQNITRIALNKITNTQINKNLISYGLFKVGSVSIFTGGSNDPKLNALEDFETFGQILSKEYKSQNNELSTNHTTHNQTQSKTRNNQTQSTKSDFNINITKDNYNNQVKTSNKSITNDDEIAGFTTKPGSSFMITYIFWSTIFTLPFIIIPLFFPGFKFISIIFIVIYIFNIIMRLILYKNTSYEFYDHKLIDRSGVINITTKEIYFKNVKHLELTKPLFFDRILNQGTIHIFTAGSGTLDNKLNSIKEYKEVYKELKERLLEEIK
jgi:uncharacterized membrane protein YdbT with pleckstrin-like domain